ncbi:MAG: hypothetical protein II916_01560, partial [Oscillospiraceae bacterium]|nr:hypothetical protein [Oscillospiraceae bacterium]
AALVQQEQRRRDAQRAAQQARAEQVSPDEPKAVQRAAQVPDIPTPEPPAQPQNEPKITGVFRVIGTKAQIIALRDFMRANQIEFQIVKE